MGTGSRTIPGLAGSGGPGPGAARRTRHGGAGGLDAWSQQFGIDNDARHNALADALATAQLLQVVLARAIAAGVTTLAELQAHRERSTLAQPAKP